MPKARPDGNSVIVTIPEEEAEVADIDVGDRLAAVAVADAVLFTNLSGEEREVYLKHLLAAQQELADDE